MFLTSRGEETGSRPWSNESTRGIPAGTWNSKSADAAAASMTKVTYRNVVVDAAAASADFEFQVPAGIPRVDSLLQGLLPVSSPREVRNIRPVPPGEDANAILAKVVARYRDLQAIAAEGSFVERVGTGGGEGTLRQTFTLAMRHPDRYRLTWSGTCSTSFDGGASRAVC